MSPYVKAHLVIDSCTTINQLTVATRFARFAGRRIPMVDYKELYYRIVVKRNEILRGEV